MKLTSPEMTHYKSVRKAFFSCFTHFCSLRNWNSLSICLTVCIIPRHASFVQLKQTTSVTACIYSACHIWPNYYRMNTEYGWDWRSLYILTGTGVTSLQPGGPDWCSCAFINQMQTKTRFLCGETLLGIKNLVTFFYRTEQIFWFAIKSNQFLQYTPCSSHIILQQVLDLKRCRKGPKVILVLLLFSTVDHIVLYVSRLLPFIQCW